MGLFGMMGKVAGSKVVEKVEDELAEKKNREQTSSYCKYINNNLDRICKMLKELENETKFLIAKIEKKGTILSFKEKGELRKIKYKVSTNLQYLYLSRDFFTSLSKSASGLVLKNEELLLIAKFAPFFDGVPVLDIDDEEDDDDSVLGAFKELGQELKESFISSKKDKNYFDFEEYLYRYEEKMDDYIIPDTESAIDNFYKATSEQGSYVNERKKTPIIETTISKYSYEIECINCHTKLSPGTKFCPECGTKVEIKKPSFCTQCGEPVEEGSRFCSNCGAKL